MRGSGEPTAYGTQSVCVFVEDEGANRQFASNTDAVVDVTRRCTSAAARYDAATAALVAARTAFGRATGAAARARLTRLVGARRASAQADQRPARSACGSELPL